MNAQLPTPEKSRAVFIASGVFNNSAFTDLDAVVRTAETLKDRLRDPAVWGISNAHCRVIKAHEWTREEILKAVEADSEAAEDCFVLYFAGHGVNENGQLLLPLLYSTAGMPSSMLEFGHLMREVGKGRAQTKLALIDCCHAGLAMGDLPFEQHVAGEAPEGCYVIAACEANRTAKSPEDHEFTAFGGALISCLAKGGPSDQEFWTPAQLLTQIDGLLTAEKHPQPVTNGSPVGELPWVKNRRYEKPFKAADLSGPAASGDTRTPAQAEKVRYLGPDPLPLPIPFLGRDALLGKAHQLVHVGKVLPVTGREQVGKSALLTALVAEADSLRQLPLPPVVLEIEPSSAAESPLLEAIARALHQTLDDSELSATVEPRTDSLLGLVLPRQVKGRSLILVIKASHIDLTRPELRTELNELLKQDVFKRAAVIVETTDSVQIDGGLWRPFDVPALTPPDAQLLIRDWLTGENLVTDVEALELVGYDEIVRRPGIIERAVRLVSRQRRSGSFENFLAGLDTDSGTAQEVAPEEFDQALMEAAEPTIAGALERAWSTVGSADRTKGQAVLTVWGIVDELPLPVDVLQRVGLPKDALRVLFNEGVLVPWRPPTDSAPAAGRTPCLEVSPVSREALRTDLLRTVRPAAEAGADGALDDLDQRLTAAARLLGSAVLPDGKADGASEDVPHVIEVLRRATGWLDRHVPDVLAGLRYRLGLYVNSQYTDARLLPVAQTIDVVTPAELPSVPQETAAAPTAVAGSPHTGQDGAANGREARSGAVQPWERIDELYAAAGRLNLASRASAREANAGRIFLSVFEYAVSLLEACDEAAPWHVLRAVDQCGFHGARRLRVLAEIVPARERLARQLTAHNEDRTDFRLNHSLWSVSWTLNTAAAQIAADDKAGAGATLQLSERLLETLPPAPDARARQTRNWLSYRMAGLRRVTAVTADERRTALRSAYDLARENTLLAADMPERLQQWTHNLLTSGYSYAQETREDRERLNLAEETLSTLEDVWGPRDEWAMPLLAEAASFLRRVHARHADSELQYAGAREVLALLHDRDRGSGQGAGPVTAMGADNMIELAEAHAFLAYVQRERNEQSAARQSLRHGVQIARKAAKELPSTHAYKTWLRLLRTMQDWFGGGRGRTLLPEHAKAVEEIRRWLDSRQETRYGNQSMALLHLWCLDSDWRREGSLPVAAKELAPHTSWNTGRSPEQVRADQVNRARWNTLQAHERVYGPTWALYDARLRIRREYQRWSAIYGKHPHEVDHRPVWELLDKAEKLFPRNLDVMRARAFYHRYIWEYGEAARLHAEAARQERDGDRRRRGLVDASECLLSQALYQEGMTALERESALRTASEYLREVAGLHSQTHRVSLLSARIALELDRPVDWDLADSKFAELIGDNYVGNVGRYLNERRNRAAVETRGNAGIEVGDHADAGEWKKATDPQESFAVDDVLEEHFTDVDVLRSLGSLYLRRSILSAEHDPEAARASAWRAYNCFDGRRVMETDLNGQEKVDTAFLRGQTITWAAELTASASPFPGESGRQRGWLHLAESRLQSARSRSAGSFHGLICTWDERLRALKSTLNDQ
ncbi:caspase family protein [Streptomyces sp. XM4193]|uniref:caspase, EACC1-associated type n=1 Tax=Streptomyces sp. XM4193 TaxID=2929782 RepID=UPI001FFA8510|nr:caspase family protein [Streptomyces sp. XM4193]MCK1796760.1 caspase family protein [Streptomyces sp. XM4193]